MELELRSRLSRKLLRTALLAALLVGMSMSTVQIVLDLERTRQLIETDAQRILHMTRDTATQAIYGLDREMGAQVLEGLFQHEAMRIASIVRPGEPALAKRSRPPTASPLRALTDALLDRERHYTIELVGQAPYNEHYGDLRITLDTAEYGAALLRDSAVIFSIGLVRALTLALILYLIYQWLLTRPLLTLIEHLVRINPERPGEHKLPLLKGHEDNELGLWVKTANGLLAAIEHNTHLRYAAESSLQRLAQHDQLTDLPNRQHLQSQLESILIEARRLQLGVAVFCIGLDDFKGINECFGYHCGDQVLVALAERLKNRSGRLSAAARLGGDGFALIQSGIHHPYEAAEVADQVLAELATSFSVQGQLIRPKATLGITLYPDDGKSAEELLQKAEQTMTLAKRNARGRYQFYIASIDQQIRQRRALQERFGEALERGELELFYQPQIDLRQHRITGFEALLRWQHPEKGYVTPDVFIPMAEQNGSIIRIGEWVLNEACRQLQQWREDGLAIHVAVNLSTIQLYHRAIPDMIEAALRRHALPAESLEVEVTETVLMDDIDTAAETLHDLRDRGILIAIDDFGTGYSSLSYLKSLPVDKIKIDKSFVGDLSRDADAGTIIRTIIQLGSNLGMSVIAEGVETAEQEAYLIEHGCSQGQGYLYSKPVPAAAVPALLERFAVTRSTVATT